MRGIKRKRDIFTVVESVDNWFAASESVEASTEVDEWTAGCTEVSHVTPVSPQEAGRVDQIPPVRTQGVGGFTNRSGLDQIPAVQVQGPKEVAR